MKLVRMEVREIDKFAALSHIFNFHYSKIMPRLTDVYLGAFLDGELVGVITLGWGVRPLHTIRVLFPSCTSENYYEIGKMCMDDKMPKNSESVFLSKVIKWMKQNTDKKMLFTWADGTLGKPGYVYQAANFKYGGFIWTDLYMTKDGERIHPRSAQGLTSRFSQKTAKYGHRPTRQQLKQLEWDHVKGKQFRYIYFTCDKKERKKLLTESTVLWTTDYPKHSSLEWKKQNLENGDWLVCSELPYNTTINSESNKTYIKNANKVWTYDKAKEFFDL